MNKTRSNQNNSKNRRHSFGKGSSHSPEHVPPAIEVVPLGAGQHVGKSCILVQMGKHNIMLDCGMHMGCKNEHQFPDFAYILSPIITYKRSGTSDRYTPYIDIVLISHFHLDHTGALPYFTEVCGYNGPIYMSSPTRSVIPILLKDMQKVSYNKFFSQEDVDNCLKKITTINLEETIVVNKTLSITTYYAGHVLGAVMFFVKDLDTGASFLYTGDYNMTSNRHLGAANISNLSSLSGGKIDLLITETTYGGVVRKHQLDRERVLLKSILETLRRGGKVLIPVFALGRVQELCILLEMYWKRMNLEYPVYFSSGMISKANKIYKLYLNWMNESMRKKFASFDFGKNAFDFEFVKSFDRSLMGKNNMPMVLFATPGMMHAGTSLEVFKKWSQDPRNRVIIPGFCVKGTTGNSILTAKHKTINLNGKMFKYKIEVKSVSFSAHADTLGITKLIQEVNPDNIVFVHGNYNRMRLIRKQLEENKFDLWKRNIKLFSPKDGQKVYIFLKPLNVEVQVTPKLIKDSQNGRFQGVFMLNDNDKMGTIYSSSEAAKMLNLKPHKLKYVSHKSINDFKFFTDSMIDHFGSKGIVIDNVKNLLKFKSITLSMASEKQDVEKIYIISWNDENEKEVSEVLKLIKRCNNTNRKSKKKS